MGCTNSTTLTANGNINNKLMGARHCAHARAVENAPNPLLTSYRHPPCPGTSRRPNTCAESEYKREKKKRKRKTTRQNQNKPKRTTQHGQCSMEERREACSLQLRGKKKGTRRAHHASLARAELRQELVPLPDTRLRLCRQVIDCKCSILSLPHLIPNILHASFNAISHPVCVLCCVQCVGLASCFRCCPNLWT